MDNFVLMLVVIVLGSAISLIGGSLLFMTRKRRIQAINIALPFGAGALLAAAFFDLLPESFELGETRSMLLWVLVGFIVFFVLERSADWFHHHHEHEQAQGEHQNRLMMIGDLLHNMIDGVAIGAAFLVNPATGIVTTLAVSAHEIPKELGTFGILLSRGWKDRRVLIANALTAIGTIVMASLVYLGNDILHIPEAHLLALTSGMFIYIAASDIIPDIHEQPRRLGTFQALILVGAIIVVACIINLLGV